MYIFVAPTSHKTARKKWYIKIAARENEGGQSY